MQRLIFYSVGKFLVAALNHPQQAQNCVLKVHSFVATPNDIIVAYEKHTAKKWTVEHITFDQLVRHERQQWKENNANAPIYTLRRIWLGGGTLYDSVDNGSLGVWSTQNLDDVIAGEVMKGGGQSLRSGQLQ